MAVLSHEQSGNSLVLPAFCVVGRGFGCSLHLNGTRVSSQHARLVWTERGWELRDLGSRNGTFVDGRLVNIGEPVVLTEGAQIGFGGADDCWTLIDATSPDDSQFVVEHEGWNSTQVEIPRELVEGSTPGLVFHVSLDEEHVELTVRGGGKEERLAARNRFYMLLVLARARIRDQADSELPEAEHGWMYGDELCRMLRIDEGRLRVDIFRIRRQLEQLGVGRPAKIIERRPNSKSLRIGLADLRVEGL